MPRILEVQLLIESDDGTERATTTLAPAENETWEALLIGEKAAEKCDHYVTGKHHYFHEGHGVAVAEKTKVDTCVWIDGHWHCRSPRGHNPR